MGITVFTIYRFILPLLCRLVLLLACRFVCLIPYVFTLSLSLYHADLFFSLSFRFTSFVMCNFILPASFVPTLLSSSLFSMKEDILR